MRVLHIADLHAGKTLGKVSRNPDLAYALEQVVQFSRESSPDLVLVAGDVFDKANPDNESKEMIFEFFLRLRDLGVEVVVIAGNHDSYDFMKSIRGLSKLANVHIYDRPSRENYLFQAGDLKVACLPYPSERVITSAGEESKRSYAELVSRFIAFLAKQVEDARHRILLAHLFVAGSRYTKTEREATVTQHYAVPPGSLPEAFDYVALGHVHRYQRIESAPTYAYYTGTPYQLDFSEAGEDKFFNLVTLEGGTPQVERVRFDLKNPLSVFDLRQGEVLTKLDELKRTGGFIKLVVRVEDRGSVPLLIDRVRGELGERLLKVELVSTSQGNIPQPTETSLNPLELYREYYRVAYGKELPKEVELTFAEFQRRAEEEL